MGRGRISRGYGKNNGFVPSTSDLPASGIYFGVCVYLLWTLTPVGKQYVCLQHYHKYSSYGGVSFLYYSTWWPRLFLPWVYQCYVHSYVWNLCVFQYVCLKCGTVCSTDSTSLCLDLNVSVYDFLIPMKQDTDKPRPAASALLTLVSLLFKRWSVTGHHLIPI